MTGGGQGAGYILGVLKTQSFPERDGGGRGDGEDGPGSLLLFDLPHLLCEPLVTTSAAAERFAQAIRFVPSFPRSSF